MMDFFMGLWDNIGSGYLVTAMAICVFAGGVVGFFVRLRKDKAEIRNLKTQIARNLGAFYLNFQNARGNYDDAADRCGQLASELRQQILSRDPPERIDQTRELFCRSLIKEAIPAFLKETEWQFLDYQFDTNPDGFRHLVDDSLKEIKRFTAWLHTINHKKLLTVLKRRPAKIERRTLRPYLNILAGLPSELRNLEGRKAYPVVDGLLAVHEVKPEAPGNNP